LLDHTSGLPNVMPDNERMVPEGSEDSAWVAVQTMPMEFQPGASFSYNQTNYVLLGRIIDTLSGMPFARFVTERQLRVAGMPLTVSAGFRDAHDVVPHSARGYTRFRRIGGEMQLSDTLRNVFEEFPPFLRTAAGMSSTAEEMARWIIALLHGRLLAHEASLTTLWTRGTLTDGSHGGFSKLLNGYALGWPVVDRPEHRAVAPVGGARSAFFVYPDDDLAIVILTNLQGSSPESFIDDVARFYLPSVRR
jgi:CubicO group peptidase (beta-lactamase class C family)